MELWERFTGHARRAVLLAHDEATKAKMRKIGTEHLLLGLVRLGEGVAAEVLQGMGIDLDRLRAELRKAMEIGAAQDATSEIAFTPGAQKALHFAFTEAKMLGHSYIGTEHILIGLVREGRGAAFRALKRSGMDLAKVRQAVAGHPHSAPTTADQPKSKTPTLDHFSRDLTALAGAGELDPLIGREDEVERVIQILSRRTKNNPCLIGEPGVGKTAIAEGLAQRIAEGDVPRPLRNKRLVSLDLASIVAGTKYRGEFEERMKHIMDEIRSSSGDIIVFLDELHTLVGTGAAEGAMDASNILKPALARGEMRCIGATTLDEYRKYVEKSSSLERRFQPIMVREPTLEETVSILRGIRSRYEEHHEVTISDEAIRAAAQLSARYISERCLPDKAIDLVDEAASRVKLQRAAAPPQLRQLNRRLQQIKAEKEQAVNDMAYEEAGRKLELEKELGRQLSEMEEQWLESEGKEQAEVTPEEIAHVLSVWTGIPVTSISVEESERLLQMEEALHRRVVGQDEAINSVSRAVRRARAGIKDPRRPTGSFIFLGPTGVGKTLLARTLAEFLFGDEEALIRIDMSEYMEKFSVSRLVGAPPGYVGYEESGQLSEAVRRRPYCVVLLDEIEKAHPEIFSILLQMMEDGRLTDSQGRVVDFKNTVIIMT
ncbi:MAG: ATP-dependent Clp protease ATP-binding subunit, partial [Armatimonadota bacterium]